MKIEISPESADEVVREVLKASIELKRAYINENADGADGWLVDEIKGLWHLMNAYNYYSPPEDHYDVPH
jgi:hypothetical protein